MNILLALNSFKGSCTSIQANLALKDGMQKVRTIKHLHIFPLCDGGDGSIEVLHQHLSISKIKAVTIDALGKELQANYLLDKIKKVAYIELASASGIAILQKSPNNILEANTIGTGKLIKHALYRGARKIILMVGGSATNDAGLGIMHELGIKFRDKNGVQLNPIPANLIHIQQIDDSSSLLPKKVNLEVWTDVNNPFDGVEGAVAIYSGQKGASKHDQILLEKA